jgi:hypothetical protein
MISKSWEKITEEDIRRLVSDAVPESHTLDYKEELPNESAKSELDFLFDVAAFANASGGDLIFGVKERRDEGRPTAIPECYAKLRMRGTLDETKRRLESLIRSGISPTLSPKINHFDNLPEGPVIVVRVPASWSAPHMITRYSKEDLKPQFYKRHNGGNHPMTIDEIRAAFTLSENRIEKLRRFRNERLTAISTNANPQLAIDGVGAKRIIHILPVNLFDPSTNVDITELENRQWGPSPAFEYRKLRFAQFNFDGYLIRDIHTRSEKLFAYVQIFRGGAIEAVDRVREEKYIDNLFELNTIRRVKDLLKILRELGTPSTLFLMISLFDVKGYPLILPPNTNYQGAQENIDRDLLVLPECVIDDFDFPIEKALRPAFDTLYQTAGMPRSFNYNEEGDWIRENIAFE